LVKVTSPMFRVFGYVVKFIAGCGNKCHAINGQFLAVVDGKEGAAHEAPLWKMLLLSGKAGSMVAPDWTFSHRRSFFQSGVFSADGSAGTYYEHKVTGRGNGNRVAIFAHEGEFAAIVNGEGFAIAEL
jgi:hypothetical protein